MEVRGIHVPSKLDLPMQAGWYVELQPGVAASTPLPQVVDTTSGWCLLMAGPTKAAVTHLYKENGVCWRC
jgi:hypothetical protein